MHYDTASNLRPRARRMAARPSVGRPRAHGGGPVAAASRLGRELESLEASLRAAERTAFERRPVHAGCGGETLRDISSRLSELDRRELELHERERALETRRKSLEQLRGRLLRGKDSLKRALARFRAEMLRQTDALSAQSKQLATARAELMEARRELAREQIRNKAARRAPANALR